MKRLVVTGSTGFVGSAIRRMLDLNSPGYGLQLIELPRPFDIRDRSGLLSALKAARPDYIIHLAAQSYIPQSFDDPRTTYEINFLGTLNLLEAAKTTGFGGRLLFVGSGDVYGLVDEARLPVCEDSPLRPRSPYAVSKVAAEALCYQWSQTEAFDVIMVRPFNHIGPGQDERFVVANFARQLARIKLGHQLPEIRVGDVDVTRDFTDVRDVVRAYLLLLRHGMRGEIYNVCSGQEQSVRDLLSRLMSISGVKAGIIQDESKLRRSEQRRIFGSNRRLKACTGWEATIGIDQSLNDVFSYWTKLTATRS